MLKKIIIAIVLLAALGGGIGVYMFNQEHSETADMEAVFSGSSDEAVQLFLDDEQAARTRYVDHVIEVSGPVMEVNKTDGKITGVKISSDEFYIVNCSFQQPVETLNQSEITVKGVCSGFLGDPESMLPGGTLELKRSVIVQNRK